MKRLIPVYKTSLKWCPVVLSLLMSFLIINSVMLDSEIEVEEDGKRCNGRMPFIMEACIKCVLAFLAGGIFSDFRFVRMGHV